MPSLAAHSTIATGRRAGAPSRAGGPSGWGAGKFNWAPATIIIGLIGLSASASYATETTLEQMPAKLESRYALSALPSAMREQL